ncbi:cytochrome-c peroxidase [Hymenobacter actinosclerus]|uniref:Cytochrome c peroxidase n=1 Tax=Hymenobacter actinosclerus TaxID=82805 RepID=A0A1I0JCW0_9BACT|nr:cytochrome c peroxidase [Hymenobacter actinosclerus]SEU07651.1 cytochrome c peroxidase [Hymenobacter actinosclerus]
MKTAFIDFLTRLGPLAGAGLLLLLTTACGTGGKADDPSPESFAAPTPYVLLVPPLFPKPLPQPADNPLTVEGIELGRHLFYEKALSLDNSKSCGSCHQQSKAFTDGLARAEGVGGTRHARSAMPLQNLLWEPRLTWDGAHTSLEQQARVPIENPLELHQPLTAGVTRLQKLAKYPDLFGKAFGTSRITEERVLKALAQFERTLVSGNSRFDRYNRGDQDILTPDEVRGMELFSIHPNGRIRGGNCSDCHGGTLQTDRNFRNNGISSSFGADLGLGGLTGKSTDNGKFRVPSLRNIALTAPYMHDGRLATLEDVLDHYNEHVQFSSPNLDPLMLNTTNDPLQISPNLELTAQEKRQIIAFLHTLTDEDFVKDPRFAAPE